MPDKTLQMTCRHAPVDETGGGDQPETGHDISAIVNALPAMAGRWDGARRKHVANGACVEFFGLNPAEIRGRSISELPGPRFYELNRPCIERALASTPQLFDRMITRLERRSSADAHAVRPRRHSAWFGTQC